MPAGGSVDMHRVGDSKVSANVIIDTAPGEQPTLAEVLENPKLRNALASCEIDVADFEVCKFRANSWDVTMKLDDGTAAQRTNHQISIEWRLRHACAVETGLERLIAAVPALPARRRSPVPRDAARKVEVALYDLHIALLAWAPETGENYDLGIARRVMADAIGQIADRTQDMGVEGYLFPIGNDLFHVNDPSGLTPMSKHRLDVDSRLPKIFVEALEAVSDAVATLAEIAPVELVWVPGNHDPQTSYFLLLALAERYRLDARVTVDTSPKPRKVWQYGVNLLWLMHGCDMAQRNEKALPGLFASEAADLWAPNQYREIHRGHTHKKNELWFNAAETYGGVVVRTIPSLVATDAWHFGKGFVETTKTAQFFVWNRDYGLESVQDVHVDKSHYVGVGK